MLKRSAHGARDLGLAQAVKFLVQFAGLVVLSRALGPTAVGIAAVAFAIVGFAEYFRDFGLSVAAIRETHLDADQRNALFWTNTALGSILGLLLLALAAPLAQVFGLIELRAVLCSLAVTFLLNGIGTQFRAGLTRAQFFRPLALADSISPLVGLVLAMLAAFSGWGYWSLVVQFLVAAFLSNAIVIASSDWLPGRPRRGADMRHLYGFGVNYALSQLIGYVGNNLHTLALGFFTSAGSAGIYSRAYQLSIGTLDQVKAPATTVILPSLASARSQPNVLLQQLLTGQMLISYATLPLAALLSTSGTDLATMLLGTEWRSVGEVISVLALAAALQQLATVAAWQMITSGRAKALRNYMSISTILKGLGVLVGVPYGIIGVGIGYTAAVAIAWPVALIVAARATSLPAMPLLQQGFRFLTLGISAAGFGWGAQQILPDGGHAARLGMALVGVTGAYGCALAFAPFRRDLRRVTMVLRLTLIK
ncbi:oligosaccharide flippase family protein [Knoellia sp. CPCC 206435]|uniref:oligosaccharide flippase family protein n=1 Tax=Knoellia terrae TaxID=3404797 RepID=UPI003B43D4F8